MQKALIAISALLLLSGCEIWPWKKASVTDTPTLVVHASLVFLDRAASGSAAARKQMWAALPAEAASDDDQLRRALLQTFPGHRGYALDAGISKLQQLRDFEHQPEIARLARLRLATLDEQMECRAQREQLQKRLDRIIEIERALQGNG